jgi:hypothetical protein
MSEKQNISEIDSPKLRGKHGRQIKLASEKYKKITQAVHL